MVINPPRNVGDRGSIPGPRRSPGEEQGNPLQSSCLENPTDREAWWAAVRRVSQSWTRLKRVRSHTCRGLRTRKAGKGKEGTRSRGSGSRSALDVAVVRKGPTDKPAFE